MYYQSPDPAHHGLSSMGLAITPSVAFRALHDEIRTFLIKRRQTPMIDVHVHFEGPIQPPRKGTSRLPADQVYEAVASYASSIAGRNDLLTATSVREHSRNIAEHGRLTREMFAMEHSLAIDLGRDRQHRPLQQREAAASMTLSVAAYWCHVDELIGVGTPFAHPVLGLAPADELSSALYDFAVAAFYPQVAVDDDPFLEGSNIKAC